MPSDEQRALWGAIRADPGDDTPRLVYADWLQEQGDELRAEFIRLQCQIVQLRADSRARRKVVPGLEHRERVLLTANRERWTDPLYRVLHDNRRGDRAAWTRGAEFRRGFVWRMTLDIDRAHRLATGAELEPLDHVRVLQTWGNYSAKKLAEVFACPGARCVGEFALLGGTDNCVGAVTLGAPTRLTELAFRTGDVTDAGASFLAEWPSAGSLATLDLSGNRIGDRGAEALANSPYLGDVTSLNLQHNPIGRAGRRALIARFGGNAIIPPDPG